MTDMNSEKIDPLDAFIFFWTNKCEELKNIPIPPEKRDEYLKDYDNHLRSFEQSNSIFRSDRGYQTIDDSFFTFASMEEITEKYCKSKYSANEISHKLDTITTSVRLVINQGEEKHQKNEREHQEKMMMNKKGFFDNAQIFLFNLIGKNK